MFLELAKFASLLLSILSLDAVFHTAFLEPGSHLEQQLLPALRMLLLAAAVCLGSGYIFRTWERRAGTGCSPPRRQQPGRLLAHDDFLVGHGVMTLLFALAWLLERYDRLWR